MIISNDDSAGCEHCHTPWSADNNAFFETYDKGVLCQKCVDAGVSTKIVVRDEDTLNILS